MANSTLGKLDALRNDLKRAVSALSMIQAALENDVACDEAEPAEALHFVWSSLYHISTEISEQVDKAYAERRAAV